MGNRSRVRQLVFCLATIFPWMFLGTTPSHAATCDSLSKLTLKDSTIASATLVPAANPVPEYCKVMGSIKNMPQSTIEFEVALPTTKWNGKYFVAGGGGFNGTLPKLDQALAEGYAAAGSDTGHKGDSLDGQWALNNLQAQVNYAHIATPCRPRRSEKKSCWRFMVKHNAARTSLAVPTAARWRSWKCSAIPKISTPPSPAIR